MPLVTLDRVSMAYGHVPLLDQASLQIEPRERVCVIGRNGTGKSTLLRLIYGDDAPQAGTVWRAAGLRVGRLAQDAPLAGDGLVFDVVAEGLGTLKGEHWHAEQRVRLVLSRLQIPADTRVATLSGGWRRRVLLARALVSAPDLLLLDEPTNHLDIEMMTWLETFLVDYAGTVLFVTHDQDLLEEVGTRVWHFENGRIVDFKGTHEEFAGDLALRA